MKKQAFYGLKNGIEMFQQKTDYTCGPACIKTVANFFGDNFTESEIAKECKTDHHGTKLKAIIKWFKKRNYVIEHSLSNPIATAEELKSFLQENLNGKQLLIVGCLDIGGHWKLIIGYENKFSDFYKDRVYCADPYRECNDCADGFYNYSAEKFFYEWHLFRSEKRKHPYILIKEKGSEI